MTHTVPYNPEEVVRVMDGFTDIMLNIRRSGREAMPVLALFTTGEPVRIIMLHPTEAHPDLAGPIRAAVTQFNAAALVLLRDTIESRGEVVNGQIVRDPRHQQELVVASIRTRDNGLTRDVLHYYTGVGDGFAVASEDAKDNGEWLADVTLGHAFEPLHDTELKLTNLTES